MHALSKLPNIGKALENQLFQVGIEDECQLRELGSKQAWMKLKEIDSDVCFQCLCALEGAIENVRWHNLSDATKQDLKQFYQDAK